MTWPEYLAGCCRIDGRLTRLRRQEAEFLLFLLVANPDKWLSTNDLIERHWPDPDKEWAHPHKFVSMHLCGLRKVGVMIEALYGRGYRVPRGARGRPTRQKLAA